MQRKNPLFSACGLNCGLCPRFHTDGMSRCPGCGGDDFSLVHPPCGILTCCGRRGQEYCFECTEYPCKRYDGINESDSFITHRNQLRDMEKAKRIGIDDYMAEQNEKIRMLNVLLNEYNDGRQKSLFCVAVNLLELDDLNNIMTALARETEGIGRPKEKSKVAARLIQTSAERCGIDLKLRKR